VKLSQRRMARPSLGGMLATRQGALILALVCAACAAGVIVIALSGYKHSVQTPVQQATVLVATGQIQKGTTGTQIAAQKLYKSTPIVATQLAPGAISDASTLQGQIASVDILPGQQLATADFVASIGATSLLAPNQRALSIPPDEVHSNLAVLHAGDHVDLYAESKSAQGSQMFLLIPDVLVLNTPTTALEASAPSAAATPANASSGSSSSGSGTSSTSSSTPPPVPSANASIVFALDSTAVPGVALSADNGTLWLALRPTKASRTLGGIVTSQTLLNEARQVAPGAPNAAQYYPTSPGGH
jgi:Flp pilus assembly protein CpaB